MILRNVTHHSTLKFKERYFAGEITLNRIFSGSAEILLKTPSIGSFKIDRVFSNSKSIITQLESTRSYPLLLISKGVFLSIGNGMRLRI